MADHQINIARAPESVARDGVSDVETADKKVGTQVDLDTGAAIPLEEDGPSKARRFLHKYRVFVHLALWLLMTGWWVTGLVLHRKDRGWLIPFLVYLGVSIRLVTFHISTKYVTKPVTTGFNLGEGVTSDNIPQEWRLPVGAAFTASIFLIVTLVGEETADNTRANRLISLVGLLVFIGAFWLTSKNRKAVKWQVVIVGMLMQYLLALFVLRTKAGYDIFNFIASLAKSLLGCAAEGTSFLLSKDVLTFGYFFIHVIPPIIFFIAFVQLLYYWGWLQWAIKKFATIFFYTMDVSGAEAVVAAASPFVGQGESAMLIKPFIPHLTDAELHQVMTSGFATIAGSVLAAYISFGISPLALISSCVMSIPASLAMSKLRWPETEEPLTAGKVTIPEDQDEKPANLSPRSQLIATYAVCGFGNISSVGIQIGVLSQLAPGRAGRIAKVALSALITGVVSTLTSASIASMLITDQGTISELLKHPN